MFPILNPPPSSLPIPSLWVVPVHQPQASSIVHRPGLVTPFIYDIIHVSMPFSQIIPPSPSPTESKILFYTSMSLLLSRIQGYCYHLSKFHIYALVQKLGGTHAQRAAAKRSYPTSEVRGSGRECQAATAQEQPRGANPRLRSEGAAERSYPASEVRGGDKKSYPTPPRPHARSQGRRPGGATPRPRSCGCAGVGGPRGAIPR